MDFEVIRDKKDDFTDRRIFARLPLGIDLNLSSLEMGKRIKIKAQSIDISANGIGFICKKRLLPNTNLDICLNIPDNGTSILAGKVVWSKNLNADIQQWRTGVELKKTNLLNLGRLITENIPEIRDI